MSAKSGSVAGSTCGCWRFVGVKKSKEHVQILIVCQNTMTIENDERRGKNCGIHVLLGYPPQLRPSNLLFENGKEVASNVASTTYMLYTSSLAKIFAVKEE
eukprot:1156790-Pelagomonas_calceolata.AAC.4